MSRPLAIPACLVAVAAACGKAADESVIRLGVAGPMTGDQAKNGEELWSGSVLAVEEWNRKGGVLGKKIELVQRDDQALPSLANQVASELIDAGVKAVIGHYNSGVTIPASQEYAKRKILMITPAATNPFITDNALKEGYRTIFRLCGRDDVQGFTGAEFVAKVLKLTRVAILHDKTQYGEGLASFFRQGCEANGVTVTLYEGFDDKETNFRPFFPKLKEGDPQLWYFGGVHSQGGPVARQAKENGIPIPFMSGDGSYHPEFINKAGEKAEGAFFTFPDVETMDAAKAFQKRYEERFNRQVGPYSVYAYAAANCVLESMAKAGSAEGEAVAKAMREMVHETVFGPVEFDEKGDVKASTLQDLDREGREVHALYARADRRTSPDAPELLLTAWSRGASTRIIALGYTMVYGILRLINFAHGEILMVGGYASVLALARLTAAGATTVLPGSSSSSPSCSRWRSPRSSARRWSGSRTGPCGTPRSSPRSSAPSDRPSSSRTSCGLPRGTQVLPGRTGSARRLSRETHSTCPGAVMVTPLELVHRRLGADDGRPYLLIRGTRLGRAMRATPRTARWPGSPASRSTG